MKTWLEENGVTAETISPAGDWLAFRIPVSKANKMLNTTFTVFRHDASGEETVRTLSYSVPADLVPHVDLVHPTVRYALTFFSFEPCTDGLE